MASNVDLCLPLTDHRTNPPATILPSPPLPATGARWALFLDVDGTLLGFADDPGHVEVPAGLRASLASLHDALGGALALVSGRRIADLDRLFGIDTAAAGLHGLEIRHDDGRETGFHADPELLARLHQQTTALAARFPGVRLEDKGPCLALHCRKAPQHEAVLADATRDLARTFEGYEVQPGDHVYELKPAGMDKGRAIVALLAEPPFAGRIPVYLGDDHTDEHAFDAVNARNGISVRVGDRQPSAARFTLGTPAAVQNWLHAVLDRLTRNTQ